MALLEEEKIGGCHMEPQSFPTRPRNCIHHVIPFSLFTEDLGKRFPANLFVKRQLIAKHGEPAINPKHVIWVHFLLFFKKKEERKMHFSFFRPQRILLINWLKLGYALKKFLHCPRI